MCVLIKREGGDCISLPQQPGSFYIGNMCALEHNVKHDEHPVRCYGQGPSSERVRIAVTLRTDVFRNSTARRKQPFHIPDLADVLAESPTIGRVRVPGLSEAVSAKASRANYLTRRPAQTHNKQK